MECFAIHIPPERSASCVTSCSVSVGMGSFVTNPVQQDKIAVLFVPRGRDGEQNRDVFSISFSRPQQGRYHYDLNRFINCKFINLLFRYSPCRPALLTRLHSSSVSRPNTKFPEILRPQLLWFPFQPTSTWSALEYCFRRSSIGLFLIFSPCFPLLLSESTFQTHSNNSVIDWFQ